MSAGYNTPEKPFVNRFCPRPEDVPNGAHYAIVEFTKLFIPAAVINGEDSRNNVGREQAVSYYYAFSTRDEWEKNVQHRILNKEGNSFIALVVNRPEVKIVIDDGVSHGKRF
jgi:hypothetical protein